MDILSFIANATVRDIGAGALNVAVVVMIFTGRLVPIVTHRREINELKESRDSWKQAANSSEEAGKELENQLYKLLETARISEKVYSEFFAAATSQSAKGVKDAVE